jgi:hypothetical protein
MPCRLPLVYFRTDRDGNSLRALDALNAALELRTAELRLSVADFVHQSVEL